MQQRLARVTGRTVNVVVYYITDCNGDQHEVVGGQNPGLDEAFEKGLYFNYPLGVDIPLYERV